jgi:PIN domain nuclease of toxin-antitoxin system
MSIVAVADTHAAIWYIFNDPRLPSTSRLFIENAAATGNSVGVSAISLAEIVYLAERSRIPAGTFLRLIGALDRQDAVLKEIVFDRDIAATLRAVDRAAIPDLPDRIIAATAQHLGVPLISRDHKIRLSAVPTIW